MQTRSVCVVTIKLGRGRCVCVCVVVRGVNMEGECGTAKGECK